MARTGVSEQAFFVLTALTEGPLHGYAILSQVGELSGGRVRPAVGTLYGIMDRLLDAGSIEVDREEVVSSRLRRYYRLTDDGRRTLHAEVTRQAANVRIAQTRLNARAPSISPGAA